jgi:HK97 family phage portal protein
MNLLSASKALMQSFSAKVLSIRHNNGQGSLVWFDGPHGHSPGTRHDYASEVGDGLNSSVLAAPLNFLLRTAPEAPPIVEKFRGGQWQESPEHDLTRLLARPNDFYSGRKLMQATILDLVFGNAYWIKVRNVIGEVVQLWWIPRSMIRPMWPPDGSVYISHYEYRVGGEPFLIPVRDVVHFRFGLDPNNHRYGLSQLGSLMREIAVDDYAANFTAALLRNMGVIGVVISPKERVSGDPESVKQTKDFIQQHFTGDNRGKALALGAPTNVELLQYNMQGFDVSPIRDCSEERVCAALGLPASIVGFGTGLQQTKVGATQKENRQSAWTEGIIPVQEDISDEVNRSLLPEFAGERGQERMRFDTSKVRALWEDANEKHTRIREDFQAKIIDRAEARRETGRVVRPEDEDVYFSGTPAGRGASANDTPKDEDEDEDEDIPAAVAARRNGNTSTNGGR